jgi:hypothetical protein
MPPPLKGLGGVDIPPKNWGPTIEALRDHMHRELDEFKAALLVLEKRTYQQKEDSESLIGKIDSLISRFEEFEDGQRPSLVDPQFEARVMAALEKRNKSTPPDVEIKSGDRSVRGQWWVVIALALCLVLFAALWQGPELIDALRGK